MGHAPSHLRFKIELKKITFPQFFLNFAKNFRLASLALTFLLILFDFDHVYKEKTQNFFGQFPCDYPLSDFTPWELSGYGLDYNH